MKTNWGRGGCVKLLRIIPKNIWYATRSPDMKCYKTVTNILF